MKNVNVLCVLVKDRRTNINAVRDELKRVIDELDQYTDNEERMEDDEEEKKYRDAMQELKLILSTHSRHKNIPISQLGQTQFQHLHERKYEDFRKNFTKAYKDTDDGNYTLLQYTTLHSIKDVVQLLLESGADPNATTEFEKRSPILIACMNKDH
jgi:hypothetical protein